MSSNSIPVTQFTPARSAVAQFVATRLSANRTLTSGWFANGSANSPAYRQSEDYPAQQIEPFIRLEHFGLSLDKTKIPRALPQKKITELRAASKACNQNAPRRAKLMGNPLRICAKPSPRPIYAALEQAA
jgi:hypothetical protein